jgi:hypothetical protein
VVGQESEHGALNVRAGGVAAATATTRAAHVNTIHELPEHLVRVELGVEELCCLARGPQRIASPTAGLELDANAASSTTAASRR